MSRTRMIWTGAAVALVAVALPLTVANPAWAADGDLDPSFGSAGVVPIAAPEVEAALARDPRAGQIVIAGSSEDGPDVVVSRRLHDGAVDPAFGTAGTFTTTWPGTTDGFRVGAVAVQPDGKVVVAGTRRTFAEGLLYEQVGLARLTAAGHLDPTFGTGGLVESDAGFDDAVRAVLVQPDGRIVVAGSRNFDPEGSAFLQRYLPGGDPDDSFDDDGEAELYVPIDVDGFSYAGFESVAVRPDGRLVAAGSHTQVDLGTQETTSSWLVARFTASGGLDAGFSGDGMALLGPDGAASSVVALSGGGALVAGAQGPDVVVRRFTSSGSLDSTFSGDGTAIVPGQAGSAGAGETLQLTSDGRPVVVGTNPASKLRSIRLTSGGALDPSFGTAGIAQGPGGTAIDAFLDPDGRLVVLSEGKLVRYVGVGPGGTVGGVDLVVTDVGWSPSSPAAGDGVRFRATIRNRGTVASPGGVLHGVGFWVNGTKVTYSSTQTASIAPGGSVTVEANGGGSAGTWRAKVGVKTVEAFVDDLDRITGETDEGNNKLSKQFTVLASGTPSSVTRKVGTLLSGSASSLAADDSAHYRLSSTTSGTRTTSWHGNIARVPNDLASLQATYRGRNSVPGRQVLSIRNWTTNTWTVLDTRTVGTGEVQVVASPPGGLADYVGGTAGTGQVSVKVTTTAGRDFSTSGDLMQITYR